MQNPNLKLLRLVTCNVNGLSNRLSELRNLASAHDFSIIACNETLLKANQRANIAGYKCIRLDKCENRRGLALYCKDSIQAYETPLPPTSFEAIGLTVKLNNVKFLIIGAYLSPSVKTSMNELSMLFNLDQQVIILGDFNAKNQVWHCSRSNSRGRDLLDLCSKNNLTIHAPDEPTYVPTNPRYQPSILDLVITKNINLPSSTTVLYDLDSDHNPVKFELFLDSNTPTPPERLIYSKADWPLFRETLDKNINITRFSTTDEIDKGIENFTNAITLAAKLAIPTSTKTPKYYTFPPDLIELKKDRNRFRRLWQKHRNNYYLELYEETRRKFRARLTEYNSEKWEKAINDPDNCHSKLWRISKALKTPSGSIPPLSHNGNLYTSNNDKADILADFVLPPEPESAATNLSQLIEQSYEANLASILQNPQSRQHDPAVLPLTTPSELKKIISDLKPRKAPGKDKIQNILLKNFSKKAIVYLTMVINACLLLQYFPTAWKHSIVVCLHKNGKDRRSPANYRPISLLPTLSKVLEKAILTRLNRWVDAKNILPNHQHGFRAFRSTNTQLAVVIDKIACTLNNNHSNVLVSLDLTKAFDMLWHAGLLFKLIALKIPPQLLLLLRSFLSQRFFQVSLNTTFSSIRSVGRGVPQGSILGPVLFILYIHDIPKTPHCDIATYADDTAIISSSMNVKQAVKYAQAATNQVTEYFKFWQLTCNPAKTQAIAFTTTIAPPPQIYIGDTHIPWSNSVKYLGVTIDKRLTFKPHLREVHQKMTKAYFALRPLLNRKSPLDKTLKVRLYVTCLRPILTYASEVWSPFISKTAWKNLQVTQNKNLKSALGLPSDTQTLHVHDLANVPLLKEFCTKIRERFTSIRLAPILRDIRYTKKGFYCKTNRFPTPID